MWEGNDAAWFCAKVTAHCAGFHGVDYLGGCSYESFEDFTDRDGYFVDMVRAAMLDALDDAERVALEGRRGVEFLAGLPRQLAGEFSHRPF